MEGLTGNWLFHNFSAQYFDAERPITPFEIIPRVRTGPLWTPPACPDISTHLPCGCLFVCAFNQSFTYSHCHFRAHSMIQIVLLVSSADIKHVHQLRVLLFSPRDFDIALLSISYTDCVIQ